jgi:hypothetical protein
MVPPGVKAGNTGIELREVRDVKELARLAG